MKQLSLTIPEEVYEQLIAAAGAAGQTLDQTVVDALRLGLQCATNALTPPPSYSAALATLQATSTRDQYLDW
jgi:hypothetical protein